MVTVSAETSLSSSLDGTWVALGRRAAYLCFPGISLAANGRKAQPRGALCHDLDLPIVDRREQAVRLSVSRIGGKNSRRERRFTIRGELITIVGRWHFEPLETGVRVHLTLNYEIAPDLKKHAVNTLRSRSPLPIRTDADAILDRAVDEFFQTRFAEQAAAYCERLRAHFDARPV